MERIDNTIQIQFGIALDFADMAKVLSPPQIDAVMNGISKIIVATGRPQLLALPAAQPVPEDPPVTR